MGREWPRVGLLGQGPSASPSESPSHTDLSQAGNGHERAYAIPRLPLSEAPSVRERGVEPPRPFGHTDLNRARLPFRHLPSDAGKASTTGRLLSTTLGRFPAPGADRASGPRRRPPIRRHSPGDTEETRIKGWSTGVSSATMCSIMPTTTAPSTAAQASFAPQRPAVVVKFRGALTLPARPERFALFGSQAVAIW